MKSQFDRRRAVQSRTQEARVDAKVRAFRRPLWLAVIALSVSGVPAQESGPPVAEKKPDEGKVFLLKSDKFFEQ